VPLYEFGCDHWTGVRYTAHAHDMLPNSAGALNYIERS
jgi:hypothetical protein